MKKFLSILMSLTLFFCSSVFAGGEDKIVYVENGDKYIFVSTENIPKLVDLFQRKLDEQESKKFSPTGNCVYKLMVAGIGFAIGSAFCRSASNIEDEDISKIAFISSTVLTTLGTLAAFFVPEYVNHKVNKFKGLVKESSASWQGKFTGYEKFESQIGTYEITNSPSGFEGLVYNLERISPAERHRIKHNKEIKYPFSTYFDPCFSDNDEGIIIFATRIHNAFDENNKPDDPLCFKISRQSSNRLKDDYTREKFGVLDYAKQCDIDVLTNRTRLQTRAEHIYRFDDELFNKIFE